jgi:hypothetical protein
VHADLVVHGTALLTSGEKSMQSDSSALSVVQTFFAEHSLLTSNYSLVAVHLVTLVLPLEKDFPSPIGFLANGGGERGGDLSNYLDKLEHMC